MIKELTATPELDASYLGRVERITDFGAFIEIMPGVRRPAARVGDRQLPRQGRPRRTEGRRTDHGQGDQRRSVRQGPSQPQGPARPRTRARRRASRGPCTTARAATTAPRARETAATAVTAAAARPGATEVQIGQRPRSDRRRTAGHLGRSHAQRVLRLSRCRLLPASDRRQRLTLRRVLCLHSQAAASRRSFVRRRPGPRRPLGRRGACSSPDRPAATSTVVAGRYAYSVAGSDTPEIRVDAERPRAHHVLHRGHSPQLHDRRSALSHHAAG